MKVLLAEDDFAGMANDPRFDALSGKLASLQKDVKDLKTKSSASSVEANPSQSENWFRRNSYWFSPAVAVAAIFISFTVGTGFVLRFLTLSVNEQIDTKLKKPSEDLHQLQIDVAKIGVRLDLREKADLRPQEFKRSLPELANTLKSALARKILPTSQIVSGLQENLLATNDSDPGYWMAVSAFVSYASQQSSVVLESSQMRPCGPLTVERMLKVRRTGQTFTTKDLSYLRCVADLDNQIVESGVILEECLVLYSGKPLKLDGVRFVNCVFELTLDDATPPAGKLLAKQILSAPNLADIRIKTG